MIKQKPKIVKPQIDTDLHGIDTVFYFATEDHQVLDSPSDVACLLTQVVEISSLCLYAGIVKISR